MLVSTPVERCLPMLTNEASTKASWLPGLERGPTRLQNGLEKLGEL